MRKTLTVIVAFLLLSFVAASPASAALGPLPGGSVRVTISAPDGVAVDVGLRGATTEFAEKPGSGTQTVATVPAAAGGYVVDLPRVMENGTSYVGRASLPVVGVLPGRTTNLDARYTQEAGASQIHYTGIAADSVSLAWTAGAPGSTTFLRRTTGPTPAATPLQGVAVPVTGTTATDRGLQPGGQYSYALFTADRTGLHGPLTLTAGTKPPKGSNVAAYVENADDEMLAPADVVSTTPITNGVRVQLAPRTPTPDLGDGMVVPVSTTLPGGLVGIVRSVSLDGRSVDLEAGGIGDVFDYYELAADNLTTPPTPTQVTPDALTPHALTPNAAGPCTSTGEKPTVDFKPDVNFNGSHFDIERDGLSVNIDAGVRANVTAGANIKASGTVDCTYSLGTVRVPISPAPVPITLEFTPVATLHASGTVDVTTLGVTATAGMDFKGSASLLSNNIVPSTVFDLKPQTPHVEGSAEVTAKVGGELGLGVNLGNRWIGSANAGVSGTLYPLDATFKANQQCATGTVALSGAVSLYARAFLPFGIGDFEKRIPIVSGSIPYEKISPWSLPQGCTTTPSTDPEPAPTEANPTLASG